jgi:hypothetical protein
MVYLVARFGKPFKDEAIPIGPGHTYFNLSVGNQDNRTTLHLFSFCHAVHWTQYEISKMLEMSSNRENLMKVVQLQVGGRDQALKKKTACWECHSRRKRQLTRNK